MNYTVKEDGTVDASYVFAVQKSEMPKNTFVDINEMVEAAASEAANNGFSTAAYDSNGYVGFKASKSMKDLELKSAGMEILGFKDLPSVFDSFKWFYTPGVFKNNYRMTLNVNLRDIIDISDLDKLPSKVKASTIEALDNSVMEINVTLPGRELLTNADEVKFLMGQKSTRYTWRLKPGEVKSLQVDAVLEKNETKSFFLYLSIGTGLLTTLFAIVLIKNRSRKRDAFERPQV